MKFKNLFKESVKPKLYTPGTTVMWTDTYISKQLLAMHLNPKIDAASRNLHDIELTTNWILSHNLPEKAKILDLGCGPGLYTEKLARSNYDVTGIDFSENSINYAEEQNRIKDLNIKYIKQNYLDINYKEEFDLIMMIYTDFGVLLPKERENLLKRIHSALKPGGIFIFDVVNENNIQDKIIPKSWEIQEKGFWRPHPYIALSESFHYQNEKVVLNQHIVIDKTEDYEMYRFWMHYFNEEEIKKLLTEFVFVDTKHSVKILSEGHQWKGENISFFKAIKG